MQVGSDAFIRRDEIMKMIDKAREGVETQRKAQREEILKLASIMTARIIVTNSVK